MAEYTQKLNGFEKRAKEAIQQSLANDLTVAVTVLLIALLSFKALALSNKELLRGVLIVFGTTFALIKLNGICKEKINQPDVISQIMNQSVQVPVKENFANNNSVLMSHVSSVIPETTTKTFVF